MSWAASAVQHKKQRAEAAEQFQWKEITASPTSAKPKCLNTKRPQLKPSLMVFILKIFRQHPYAAWQFLYPSCSYLDFSIQGGRYCSCWPCKHRVSWQRVLPIAGGEQWDQKRLDLQPTRKIHKVSFMSFAFGIFWVWCKNQVKWKSQTRWHDIMMYTIVPKLRLG